MMPALAAAGATPQHIADGINAAALAAAAVAARTNGLGLVSHRGQCYNTSLLNTYSVDILHVGV